MSFRYNASMENWDDYRFILALHRAGTLRRAAQLLRVNHATVSRRLQLLNKQLGTIIFEPSPKGYRLTQFGLTLLESAEKVEKLASHDLRKKLTSSSELAGKITLSIPPAIAHYLLLEPLNNFQIRYPKIQLNINTSYTVVDLDQCEADVVVRVMNQPQEHLLGYRIVTLGVNYYANQRYLDTRQPEDYRWITQPFVDTPPDWIKYSPFPQADVSLQLDDLMLRHLAAARGFGMIRGAAYIANQIDGLIPINTNTTKPYQDIWVLTHPELKNVPRISLLTEYLAEQLRAKKSLITGDQ